MRRFTIRIEYERRYYRMIVEEVETTPTRERYRIIGRDRSIVIESNRPLFRNKGISRRPPGWSIIEGEVRFRSTLELAINEIMKFIDK